MGPVLITGANGFVGYYLTRLLLSRKIPVLATGKGECRAPFRNADFRYVELDFTNAAEVDRVVGTAQPSAIVHCGAESRPDACEQDQERALRINVAGTRHLLVAAERARAYFLFLSTDFVFDGETGMYREDDPRNPVNFYGRTKVLAEDLVMAYPHPWAIVRTVLVYGKPVLSRHNLVTNTAQALREGRPLKIFRDQVRTPTYVEDLVWGIVRLLDSKGTGIFHLSGKDALTPYEIAVAVARLLQLDDTLITPVVESEFAQPARRPPKTGFDLGKARSLLGYEPVPFAEGLQKTIAFHDQD